MLKEHVSGSSLVSHNRALRLLNWQTSDCFANFMYHQSLPYPLTQIIFLGWFLFLLQDLCRCLGDRELFLTSSKSLNSLPPVCLSNYCLSPPHDGFWPISKKLLTCLWPSVDSHLCYSHWNIFLLKESQSSCMSGEDVSSVFPRWSPLSPIAVMSKTQMNTIYFSPESTSFASVQEEREAAPRSLLWEDTFWGRHSQDGFYFFLRPWRVSCLLEEKI